MVELESLGGSSDYVRDGVLLGFLVNSSAYAMFLEDVHVRVEARSSGTPFAISPIFGFQMVYLPVIRSKSFH